MRSKRDHMLPSIIAADFSSWIHSSRIVISLICVLVYCLILSSQSLAGKINGETILLSLEEKVYLQMCHGYNKMGSLLFLLMISELPRRTAFHYYTAIRTSRWKWLLSQLVYIALISASILLIMTLLHAAIVAPSSTSSPIFTDDKMVAQGIYREDESIISSEVRKLFSPLQAILWASLPVYLFWCIMGYTVLLFSLLGHPLVGPSFFGFILMGLTNVNWEAAPEWFHLPIEYANVSAIRAHPELDSVQGINQVNLFLVFTTFLLVGILSIVIRKMDYSKITKAW